jgi:hypothetical protein
MADLILTMAFRGSWVPAIAPTATDRARSFGFGITGWGDREFSCTMFEGDPFVVELKLMGNELMLKK